MIRSNANALLAEGTDWRFINELKRELKACPLLADARTGDAGLTA